MGGACMLWWMCGHQRANCRCCFLSSAMRASGVKLRASNLVASDFTQRTVLPTNSCSHISISVPHPTAICLRMPHVWLPFLGALEHESLSAPWKGDLSPRNALSKPIPIYHCNLSVIHFCWYLAIFSKTKASTLCFIWTKMILLSCVCVYMCLHMYVHVYM